MKMKVTDYIVTRLYQCGVRAVFGYQGGNITHLIDSIGKVDGISFVENYHEQASAFSANAYSLISNTIGVAISSSGPGAINLISGIANSYFDSIPCLFITGAVNTSAMRQDPKVRQSAFQETDIVSIVKPITKYATTILKVEDVAFELNKAIKIALEQRQGPVLLNIPHDIQRGDIEPEKFEYPDKVFFDAGYTTYMQRFKELLLQAERPLLLVGGGARSTKSKALIKALLGQIKIPVVSSLCGLDVLPHNHECYCGFIGTYGNRYANLAIQHSDLLIVLGSRLDDRQIPSSKNEYLCNKKVIHVDIDPIELNRVIDETLSINLSVEEFLSLLQDCFTISCDYSSWINTIHTWEYRFPSWCTNSREVNSNDFIHTISASLSKNSIICVDVGQNQMCVAQTVYLSEGQKILNSSGLGAMGYALPAAIGASYATNKLENVLCIAGDGGIQMNIQELQTVIRDDLPIHILIMNNHCLGMIRDYHTKMFDNRFFGSVEGFDSPSYEALAKAYGFAYLCVDSIDRYNDACDMIKAHRRSIIEIILPQAMTTNPDPGKGIFKQFPPLSCNDEYLLEKESHNEKI
ncbi:MAG: thiamine pyrophosphate-binding protein [Saccharofermentanales bacterium]